MKNIVYVLFVVVACTCVFINEALSKPRHKRLLNARSTQPNEYGYVVAFQNDTEHLCGGSLISPQHVLTAAHCVIVDEIDFRAFPLKIIAGVNDLNAEMETRVVVEVERIYVTDRYNHSYWSLNEDPLDDIAVLKLKKKLDIDGNPGLALIKLPPKPDGKIENYANLMVKIAGFGYDYMRISTENNKFQEKGNSTGKLQQANVFIFDNALCEKTYTYLYRRQILDGDAMLCGRIVEHDDKTLQGPCTGDSGSPLIYDGAVIGFLRTSVAGCDDNFAPSTYSKVQPYLRFITNAMVDVLTDGMRVAIADPDNEEFGMYR